MSYKMKGKLDDAETATEVIEALIGYYIPKWKEMEEEKEDLHEVYEGDINKAVLDRFFGSFLVDLEACIVEKFPEAKRFIRFPRSHIHFKEDST